MNKEESFQIEDVIAVATGRFFGDSRIEGMRRVVSHLVGRSIGTAEAGSLRPAVIPGLCRQHPKLAGLDTRGVNILNEKEWLKKQREAFGAQVCLTTLPEPEKLLGYRRPPPSLEETIAQARYQLRR